MALAKDEFSKTKFTYLELLSKQQFILSIVDSSGAIPNSSELEDNLAQSKAVLKKSKGRCKTLKTELETLLAEVCRKENDLQTEAALFASSDSLTDAPESLENYSTIENLKLRIEQKQASLEQQEASISELNKQKTELELAVKGLESNLLSKTPFDRSRLISRRMLNWYTKANAVLRELCRVGSVDVKESEVCAIFFLELFVTYQEW